MAAPSPGLPYLAFRTPLWGPPHAEEVTVELLFSISGTGRKGDIIRYPRSVLELKTGALGMGRACPPRPCKPHGTGACTVGHVWVQRGDLGPGRKPVVCSEVHLSLGLDSSDHLGSSGQLPF